MSNISKSLSKDLKNLSTSTNTSESLLEIKAEKESALYLNEKNSYVQDIVDYTSKGGGSIDIKVKGIRKIFKTADKLKDISIDEIQINGEGKNIEQTIKNIRKFLDEL